jgi:hypothetical protein
MRLLLLLATDLLLLPPLPLLPSASTGPPPAASKPWTSTSSGPASRSSSRTSLTLVFPKERISVEVVVGTRNGSGAGRRGRLLFRRIRCTCLVLGVSLSQFVGIAAIWCFTGAATAPALALWLLCDRSVVFVVHRHTSRSASRQQGSTEGRWWCRTLPPDITIRCSCCCCCCTSL